MIQGAYVAIVGLVLLAICGSWLYRRFRRIALARAITEREHEVKSYKALYQTLLAAESRMDQLKKAVCFADWTPPSQRLQTLRQGVEDVAVSHKRPTVHDPVGKKNLGYYKSAEKVSAKVRLSIEREIARLTNFVADCDRKLADVDRFPDMVKTTRLVLDQLEKLLSKRQVEGWAVDAISDLFTLAFTAMEGVDQNVRVRNYTAASSDLETAHTYASRGLRIAQDLEHTQFELNGRVRRLTSELEKLVSALNNAHSFIEGVENSFAPVCAANMYHQASLASRFHSEADVRMPVLRACTTRKGADWEKATQLANDIQGLLGSANQQLQLLRGTWQTLYDQQKALPLKSKTLRSKLNRLWIAVGQLPHNPALGAEVEAIDNHLTALINRMGQPHPNPAQLTQVLEDLDCFVERLQQVTCAIRMGELQNIEGLKLAAAGTMTALD